MAEGTPPPPPRPSRGPGAIAAFLGLLVAFNTLVYSCSTDRLARENAQLQRFATDEKFWTDAMRDLSALVAERGKADTDQTNWDSRCRLLALRTSPFSFDQSGNDRRDEGEESLSARAQANQNRIEQLKLAFVQRIQDPTFVTDGCRKSFASQQFAAAQDDAGAPAGAIQPAAAATAPGAAPTPGYDADAVTTSAIAQRANIIALTPPNPTGWDLDVFWCDRRDTSDAGRNYADALGAAQQLAARAQAGERVGGQSIGRIRVRILPVEQQGRHHFPASGALIRADTGAGEADFAGAVRQVLQQALPQLGIGVEVKSRTLTRWYLSLYLCRAPRAAAAKG